MRITFATVNRNVQRNLSRRYSDLVGLQEQLATGKRLRKASDDPIDVANTIKLRAKESQLSQYKRNIQDGLAIMGVASSAMASMNDILHRARELAVQAANGTYNDSDRLYMQQEVDQLFRQMMSVVNTKFKGTYIFNGTNGNVPPYKIASSGTERVDYDNRTMATFGTVFARQADGKEWNTPNIPDPAVVTAATHTANGDNLYLNYATSHLRIGDKVQLTWNSSADTTINGRSLQYIYPETMPLDTITIAGAPRQFTNGVKSEGYAGSVNVGATTQLIDGTNPVRNISRGSFVITATNPAAPGSPTYTLIEGKDYNVNYESGTFTLLNSGYSSGSVYDLDVKYRVDGELGDYAVDYVTGQVSILSEDFRDALNGIPNTDRSTAISVDYNPATPLPSAPNGLTYRTDNVFQIVEGKLGDTIRDIFPGSMKIKIGNKEYVEGHGEYQPDYYDENGVLQPGKNKYDYSVDYETGMITVYNTDLMRDMRPEWLGGPGAKNQFSSMVSGVTGASAAVPLYYYPNIPAAGNIDPATVKVTAGGVLLTAGVDYDAAEMANGNFKLLPGSSYDNIKTQFKVEFGVFNPVDPPANMYSINQLQITFDYITRGVDMYGDMVTSQGDILRIIEDGIVVPINIGADALLKDAPSGNDMVGTLLRYSQALLKDDRDGIQNALDELTTMYDAVLNSQSKMGAQIFRFELTEQRNGEQAIEVGAQVSSLADADLAEVISKLMLAESVYNAALQAAMRVLQPSLANYM
ncbi:MAG: flagellar hook-associated protein FlgL [Chitinispirillales bacterium]|jgi:flagellin-like hook-associated protein FlgL|nr:flagellar hook-associated protein FlgL [Chitinispirillales bacterium]